MKKFDKVLLVDDDPVINFLNESLLIDLNLAEEILVKQNGEVALEFIKKHCIAETEECPNLILLDLNMPIMSGFELLEELHRMNKKCLIYSKIVVLTSSDNDSDIKKLKSLGVTRILEKPLTKEKAIVLQELLEQRT